MNNSYKIALVAAIIMCVAAAGYYVTRGQPVAEPDLSVAAATEPLVSRPVSQPPGATPSPTSATASADSSGHGATGTSTLSAGGGAAPQPPLPARTMPTSKPPTLTFGGTGTMPAPAPAPTDDTAGVTPSSSTPVNRVTSPRGDGSPPTLAAVRSSRTYTIKRGDSFSSIAAALYGSERFWIEIAQANPSLDPMKLKVGDVIRLPDLATSGSADAGAAAAATPTASDNTIRYIVRPGDTLGGIARQYYNDPGLWQTIYRANRGVIGSNPDRVVEGTVLIIPPTPHPAR